MKRLFLALAALFTGVLIMSEEALALDLENTLYMDLQDGRVVIEMRDDLAPKHVTRIKQLTREGFYDGLKFHRVIEGFMAQGGDPDGNGTGGSGVNIPAEFTSTPFERGTVGMARNGHDINSGDSQFYIMFDKAPFLNGQYTVWGQVVKGMEFIDNIKRGEGQSGAVADPADVIVKMQVAADAQ